MRLVERRVLLLLLQLASKAEGGRRLGGRWRAALERAERQVPLQRYALCEVLLPREAHLGLIVAATDREQVASASLMCLDRLLAAFAHIVPVEQ